MSVSAVPAELVEAYNSTQYLMQTENGEIVLRIGEPSKAIAELIEAAAADGGVFITAENLFSQPLTVDENKDRQDRLRKDLAVLGALVIDGAGQGEDPSWPAEASYSAIGITRDQACELGIKYEQNAIVWFDATGTGELILLR